MNYTAPKKNDPASAGSERDSRHIGSSLPPSQAAYQRNAASRDIFFQPPSPFAPRFHTLLQSEQTRSTSGDLNMDGGNLLFDLSHSSSPPRRPQAVRDTLMAFLTEPRTVKEIAAGIDKTTSTVTGHLCAMRRKNLVVRLSWGVWVRRDKCEAAPDHASIRRPNPAQERLLAHLAEPRTLAELQEITKRRGDILLAMLMKMIKRGDVEHRADERFAAICK